MPLVKIVLRVCAYGIIFLRKTPWLSMTESDAADKEVPLIQVWVLDFHCKAFDSLLMLQLALHADGIN